MAGVMQRPDGERVAVVAGGLAIRNIPLYAYDEVKLINLDTLEVRYGPSMPTSRYGGSAIQYR